MSERKLISVGDSIHHGIHNGEEHYKFSEVRYFSDGSKEENVKHEWKRSDQGVLTIIVQGDRHD